MKIIIVDDEKEILDDISQALMPTGYELTLTTSPFEALKLYKKTGFDVVITDIRMPEMTGIELLKEIRKFDKNAYVIIITAFGDLDTAKQAINNHAYAFFGKPIQFKDLILTLREIEKDKTESIRNRIDFDSLKEEHLKLKSAYKNMIHLLNQIENGKESSDE